nr:phage tail protein [Butyrivibrio sp.]
MAGVQYSIKKNRLKRSCITGFDMLEDNSLVLDKDSLFHSLFIPSLDGVDKESTWGRLSFDILIDEDMIYYAYVLAYDEESFYDNENRLVNIQEYLLNPDIDGTKKVLMMQQLGATRFISQKDVLLYNLKGRYLYIAIEVFGEGSAYISNIKVDAIGDNFMNTFPEIYHDRDSFFHRYLSIYSSIYNDMQDKIDNMHEILDLDTCSTELLELYSSWMGIDLHGGFLSEDVLRKLVKELYNLNKMKGTKASIKRLLEIVLDCNVIIIEHSYLLNSKKNDDIIIQGGLEKGSVYDVTVLVEGKIT